MEPKKPATLSSYMGGMNVVYKLMHGIPVGQKNFIKSSTDNKYLEDRDGIIKKVDAYVDGTLDGKKRSIHAATKIYLSLIHHIRSTGLEALEPDAKIYSRLAKVNTQKVNAEQDKQETTTKQKENLPLPHEIVQNGIILHNRARAVWAALPKTTVPVINDSSVMDVLLGNLAYQLINMEGSVVFRNQGVYDVAIAYPGSPTTHPNFITPCFDGDMVITYNDYKTAKSVARERTRMAGIEQGAEMRVIVPKGSKAHEAFWMAYDAWPHRQWLLPKLTKDEKRTCLSALVGQSMWVLDDGKKPLGGNYRTVKQTVQMMDPKLVKTELRQLQEMAFQTKGSDIRHVYNKKDLLADFKASLDLIKYVDPATGSFYTKNKKRVSTLLDKIKVVHTNKVLVPLVKPAKKQRKV